MRYTVSEQWLSISEFARSYNLSDMTVRRRIKTGRLHAVLREGKYYIPASAGRNRPIGNQTFLNERTQMIHEPVLMEPARPAARATNSFSESAEIKQTSKELKELREWIEQALQIYEQAKKDQELRHLAEVSALNAKIALRDGEIHQLKQELNDFKSLLSKINEYRASSHLQS